MKVKFNALYPTIKKAKMLYGNNLIFKNATIDDADFILSLRLNPKKGQFLSVTDSKIETQKKWLKDYALSKDQAYFIIFDDKEIPVGTVRIYNAVNNSFCWGSWIIKDGARISYSIESALMVYHYCLYLGFSEAHIDVRNGNLSVRKFHERFGAKVLYQTELDTYYTISNESIIKSLKLYDKFLPEGIVVEQ